MRTCHNCGKALPNKITRNGIPRYKCRSASTQKYCDRTCMAEAFKAQHEQRQTKPATAPKL